MAGLEMRHADSDQIDWSDIHRRLDSLRVAIDATTSISPEAERRILEERARALAQKPDEGTSRSDVLEVIRFAVGEERFALATMFVREVVRPTEVTPVPGTPDFLVGVTNLRGEVLAVMDLGPFLGRAASREAAPWIIVLGTDRSEFGIQAGTIEEIGPLEATAIIPPSGSLGIERGEFVRGLTDDAVLCLDGEAILEDPRLYIDVT
ncbi:Chemotaxis protein CheV [Maioricimonas rarisocia]|uniref:Chemotaxis protein CheV n=1 Tax=Maioricimonas rarisocia TaxID=2528026 RepID=A0A517ZAJ7_9PLAN|nr:chemotaxis protein CheW [Maioricimonas rarisocia]QDU39526.1 Chemotaxis protein CheV [Maioricimonas rarisocia]